MCKVVDLNWERRAREIDDMVANTEFEDIDATMAMVANQIAMIEMLEEIANTIQAKGITTEEEILAEIDKQIALQEVKIKIQEENIARLKEMVEDADYYFTYKGIRSFVECDIEDILATVKKVDLVSEHGQYANLIMWDGEEATIEVI